MEDLSKLPIEFKNLQNIEEPKINIIAKKYTMKDYNSKFNCYIKFYKNISKRISL
jgi:hypothetical protein